jgi:AAA15 family ATPase/GTPase
MLTALRIGNFKAFAETQRIPARPLLLTYGTNSSGKTNRGPLEKQERE